MSRAPSRCISVDLPEPDGPMIETNSPASMRRLTPCNARTMRAALRIMLRDLAEFHHDECPGSAVPTWAGNSSFHTPPSKSIAGPGSGAPSACHVASAAAHCTTSSRVSTNEPMSAVKRTRHPAVHRPAARAWSTASRMPSSAASTHVAAVRRFISPASRSTLSGNASSTVIPLSLRKPSTATRAKNDFPALRVQESVVSFHITSRNRIESWHDCGSSVN